LYTIGLKKTPGLSEEGAQSIKLNPTHQIQRFDIQQAAARLSRYNTHSKTLQSISPDVSHKYDIKSAALPNLRDLMSSEPQPGSDIQQPLEASPAPQFRSHTNATLKCKIEPDIQ
jgi:hypothetical protein